MLGDLLKATQCERWLCGEALDSLVTEASTTLVELSGGQYELDRTERNEFVVIDYDDAGTRRPVHTLSGGETFQASLALALSRQVVGLSAGMRDLDSMFLGEGFGTLDDNTLDRRVAVLAAQGVSPALNPDSDSRGSVRRSLTGSWSYLASPGARTCRNAGEAAGPHEGALQVTGRWRER